MEATTTTKDALPGTATTKGITLKALTEYPALSSSDSSDSFAVRVSILAPSLPSDEHKSRAPLDLVAVLDVSGSMHGEKLKLVREAMCFVIDNLGPNDRLSVVSFSTTARKVLKLCQMSEEGKGDAIRAVNSLTDDKLTNIVAGLKKGVKVLDKRGETKNPVASIILLSDGQDNQNNSDGGFVKALEKLQLPSGVPIHTFGFGSDHDAASLHAVSEVSSGGMFSFVESIEAVKMAFARCLGGLLSVVAQETELLLDSASSGAVRIVSLSSGRFKSKLDEVSGQAGLIQVGELYAEEEKHFLAYLYVPKLEVQSSSAPESVTETQLLNIRCSYTNPITKEKVKIETYSVKILRPHGVLSPEDKKVNLEVDREKNKDMVAEAIARAQEMADEGDTEGARAFLEEKREMLLASPSRKSGDTLCISLEDELKEIRERMRSRVSYETEGRGYMIAECCSLRAQRAVTQAPKKRKFNLEMCKMDAPPGMKVAYETSRMLSMVQKAQEKPKN